MDGSGSALILLTGAIFISLVIERLLEILKSLFDVLEAKHNWHIFWNEQALKLRQKLENFIASDVVQDLSAKLGMARVQIRDTAYANSVSISVSQLRSFAIKYAAKLLGIVLGITVAWIAEIDMFLLIDRMLHPNDTPIVNHPWLTQMLTGIAMGLGSGPMHKIISRMEKAKNSRVPHA